MQPAAKITISRTMPKVILYKSFMLTFPLTRGALDAQHRSIRRASGLRCAVLPRLARGCEKAARSGGDAPE